MSGRNMEEYDVQRPVHRTRRKKTPWQKFKEAYLPLVIVLLGIILIITLIVGIVKLAAGGSGGETTIPKQTLEDTTAPPDEDVSALLTQAGELASHFDYDGAIALLQTSSDSRAVALANQYTQEKDSLVVWKDNTDVPHISFQQLVVDTGRAFDGDSASGDYKDYNLTVDEFRAILDQLYANGYVLISSTDIAAANGEGKYAATEIRLPSDRQPLMMSLIPAHYSLDMAGVFWWATTGKSPASTSMLPPPGSRVSMTLFPFWRASLPSIRTSPTMGPEPFWASTARVTPWATACPMRPRPRASRPWFSA